MKQILITGLIAVFGGASAAFGQVDTLELVEVGRITLPQTISNLYVQDLNGDSLMELILTDSNYVYVYDGPTRVLNWQSPQMERPRDLQLGDLNGDGLIDIAVRDNQYIRLYDPHDSTLIWTSTTLDTYYKCYTLGLIDDDSINDVIFVTKEPPVGYGGREDTVWVDYFVGPDFGFRAGYTMTMTNISFYDAFRRTEYPVRVYFDTLTGGNGMHRAIVVISSILNWMGGMFQRYDFDGGFWVYDLDEGINRYMGMLGCYLSHQTYSDAGDRLMLLLNESSFIDYSNSTTSAEYSYVALGLDSVIASRNFCVAETTFYYNSPPWPGAFIFNMNDTQTGPELCFACRDSIYENSLYSFGNIWRWPLPEALFIGIPFEKPALFEGVHFLAKTDDRPDEYRIINGNDGEVAGVLGVVNIDINAARDLNNDGDDELLSVQGNALSVYNTRVITSAGDNQQPPTLIALSPAYPNPFNGATMISFSLAGESEVAMEVFDILGRKVAVLSQGLMEAGQYRITWEAGNEPSGVYFYRLRAGESEQTRRMLLLK